jgi:hypothetical protein
MIYNSYDYQGNGFNFSEPVSIINTEEFINYMLFPAYDELKNMGYSDKEIIIKYGWSVI